MPVGKPNWSCLPVQEKMYLTTLYSNGQADEFRRIADSMGINVETLGRQIRTYKRDFDEISKHIASTAYFPESVNKPYKDYLVVEQDSAIVVGDIEIPDQDSWMLKAALLVGMRRGIKTLIYNGDIVATDQTALTKWIRVWREEQDASYQTAVDQTQNIMLQYGKWFDKQYLVSGNHDIRINKKTGGEVFLEMLLKQTPTVFSKYSYMYMKTHRGWVYICHPDNYSIHAASKLGNDLWATHVSPEGTKCHIVLGHTHLDQSAWSPDGQQEIHSSGCMRRQAAYADIASTNNRAWQRGFLVIDDGYFQHYTEYGTNWANELGELYKEL